MLLPPRDRVSVATQDVPEATPDVLERKSLVRELDLFPLGDGLTEDDGDLVVREPRDQRPADSGLGDEVELAAEPLTALNEAVARGRRPVDRLASTTNDDRQRAHRSENESDVHGRRRA